jgi:O-acetylhomoserine (thiol)-lyase
MRNETIAIHAGYDPDPTTKAVAVPIYQTASYAFDSADHGAALFNLEAEGFRYSRIANPTSAVLEKRIAELEGGVGALAVATGQAALHFSFVNLADGGGNIVSVPQLYGTTHTLLAHILPRQGIMGRFAESDCPEAIEKLIDESTKAVFAESIGNPAGNVCDIEALAKVAHRYNVPLIVDNTVATPILLKPFNYGADIVVHSLTKFLGGHGTTLGGAIVDSGRFPWKDNARFPAFNHPDASYHGLIYAERFGAKAYIERARSVQKYLDGNASALFTFGIKGGMDAGKAFYDALKLITRLVNIGDAKSLACHPASTTHRQMSREQQRIAGVMPETIRLSVGIEHVADIIEDIDQALAKACPDQGRLEAAE